ncbi:MAG: tetratricopeptide repeat protein [Candidatus Obscuribacterales bacterium]|nr:tetratricopeptide repeat protein [Candidatus Obscuribacterales bacterium]
MTEKIASSEQALSDAETRHKLAQYSEAELLYRKARTSAEAAGGADSPVAQRASERLARLYITLADAEKAGVVLKQLRESKERTHGAHHPDAARIVRKIGDVLAMQSRQKEAMDAYAHAVDIWVDHLGPVPTAPESDLGDFDAMYGARSRFGSAESIFAQLQSHKATAGSAVVLAEHLSELAVALKARGAKALPLSLFQYACRTLQTLPLDVIWSQSDTIIETGTLLIETERFAEAESFLKGYLEFFDRGLGSEHDLVPDLTRLVARACQKQNRMSDAETFFRRTLKLQEETLSRSHPAMAVTLTDLAALYLAERDYPRVEDLLKRALRIRENTLGFEHLDVATTLCQLGDVQLHANQLPAAEQSFQRAVRIYENKYGATSELVAPLLDKIAQGYLNQYKYLKAETILHRSLELKHISLPADHKDIATVSQQIARLYVYWGRPVDAESYYKRALEILESHSNKELVSRLAEVLGELAVLYAQQCRTLESEKLLRRAIELCEDSRFARAEDLPTLRNHLADLYVQTRRLRDVTALSKEVLASCDGKNSHSARTEMARAFGNLAMVAALQCNTAEARTKMIEALRVAAPGSPQSLASQIQLIRFCIDRGERNDAEQLLNKTIEQCLQICGSDKPDHANLLELVASIKLDDGDYDSVMNTIKQITNIREQWQGSDHPSHAAARVLLARLYMSTNALDYAEEAYHKALSNMERSLGAHHHELARTLLLLSVIYCRKEKPADAGALTKRALRIWERAVPGADIALLQALCDVSANRYFATTAEEHQIINVIDSLVQPCIGLYAKRAVSELTMLIEALLNTGRKGFAVQLAETLFEVLSKAPDVEIIPSSQSSLQRLIQVLKNKAPELATRIPSSLLD